MYTKHGLEGTRFCGVYRNVLTRCNNSKSTYYSQYGGRGIKCEWKSLADFKSDMYESYLAHVKEHGVSNTTLDRVDNNGQYTKSNCRWATKKQQARNTRRNVLIEFQGENLCIAEWAERSRIDPRLLWIRIFRLGWSIKKALTQPVRHFK